MGGVRQGHGRRYRGGIPGLLSILDDEELREALELDLLPAHDLGDYYTGDLTLRRLRLLIRSLPPDSRLGKLSKARRAAAGIVDTPQPISDASPDIWSQEEWLLVAIHDQLQLQLWSFLQAHSQKRIPMPKLLPRPGEESTRRKTLNSWFGAVGLPPIKPPAPTT